ncbi:MAG: PIN domain-containing protein [Opitutales bacterium]
MILDTNALSALAGHDRNLVQLVDNADQAVLPFAAVAEFQYGLLGSTKPEPGLNLLNGLMQILPLLLPDAETIQHFAVLAHRQKQVGRPVPTNDLWIAALAHQHALPVLSRDQHFDAIPDIRRIDW